MPLRFLNTDMFDLHVLLVAPGCCYQVGFYPSYDFKDTGATASIVCSTGRGSQKLAPYAIRLRILHLGSCFFGSSTSHHFHRCPIWGKNVTVSAIRPLLKHIVEKLMTPTDADCTLVKEMKETIIDDLQARYISGGVSSLLTCVLTWIQGSECGTFRRKRRLLLG